MRLLHRYHSHSLIRKCQRELSCVHNSRLIKKNGRRRILVVLSLSAPDTWAEIREYLHNFRPYPWDLYVTFPESLTPGLKKKGVLRALLSLNPGTRFLRTKDNGQEPGPFLEAIRQIDLSDYDIVFRLPPAERKGQFSYKFRQLFWGRDWLLNLYEGTAGTSTIHETIDKICNDPAIAMIGAQNLIVHDPVCIENLVIRRLQAAGLPAQRAYRFLAGSCFAIKPSLLHTLKGLPFTQDDFVQVPSSRGISLGDALERYICMIPQQCGLRIEGNDVLKFRHAIKQPVRPFLSRLSAERLLDLPFKIDDEYYLWRLDNRFVRYRVKKMPVGELKYQMGPGETILPLRKTFPYRYLQGDIAAYEQYCRIHAERGYPAMSRERFEELIASMSENGYDPSHIILVNELGIIRDGQHRACFLAYKYGLDYEIEVLEVETIDKLFLARQMIPPPALHLYYQKRYGLH